MGSVPYRKLKRTMMLMSGTTMRISQCSRRVMATCRTCGTRSRIPVAALRHVFSYAFDPEAIELYGFTGVGLPDSLASMIQGRGFDEIFVKADDVQFESTATAQSAGGPNEDYGTSARDRLSDEPIDVDSELGLASLSPSGEKGAGFLPFFWSLLRGRAGASSQVDHPMGPISTRSASDRHRK